ncbi:hypothetical protein GGR01_002983 [Acetobacter oeni]|nr:hypothetical protein [Acetobacter oeni]
MHAFSYYRAILILCPILVLCTTYCGHTAVAADYASPPAKAQSQLAREALSIHSRNGIHRFSVEIAKTPREQEVGEMFRPDIPPDGGMLFVWPAAQQSDMWMENTLCSLDIVFIGEDHRIQSVIENTVPESLARLSSHAPVVATLELQGGITAKLGISVGDVVNAPIFDKKKL